MSAGLGPLLSSAGLGVAIVRPDGSVRWNTQATEWLGVHPNVPVERALEKAMPQAFRNEIRDLLDRAGTGEPVGPARGFTTDGSIPYEAWAGKVGEDRVLLLRRGGASGLPADVGERLERLATLGMVSAGVAHDFNNVVTAILGWAQIALRDPRAGDTVESALRVIETNARRAKGVIRDLFETARSEEGPRLPVAMASAVDEVLRLLQSWIRTQQITVEREYEKVVDLTIDRGRLHQILLNLSLNAIQAMPDGGTLHVKVGPLSGGGVELVIRDTGEGMDASTLSRAFDPFFTTKHGKEHGGTGLGLTLCRRFVEEMGGTIRVASEAGKGAAFTLSFPERAAQQHSAVATSPEEAPLLDCRVLVVDDEPDIREMLTLALRLRGVDVTAVPDAPSATALLKVRPFDIVLLDYTLPGSHGDRTLREILAARSSVRVLYISGRTGVDVPIGGQGEAAGWIHKPFDLDQVYRAIEAVLQ